MNCELIQRITNYLSAGGLVNPELMEHEKVRDLLIDCRDELAKPEQEPNFCKDCGKGLLGKDHIHTCSPQVKRQWVGLTDDEVLTTWLSPDACKVPQCDKYHHFYVAIESKLKEKNT
jgi:hypothetical protein